MRHDAAIKCLCAQCRGCLPLMSTMHAALHEQKDFCVSLQVQWSSAQAVRVAAAVIADTTQRYGIAPNGTETAAALPMRKHSPVHLALICAPGCSSRLVLQTSLCRQSRAGGQ